MEGVGKNGEGPGWRGEGGTGDGDSILLAFKHFKLIPPSNHQLV